MLAQARRALRGKKGDTCIECRAIGLQMTNGEVAICNRSRTEECARKAAVIKATEALTNPSALIALRLFDKVFSQWNATMGERFGLKYGVLWEWADRFGVPVDEETMEYVQVLETEQLDAWASAKPVTVPK